MTRPSTVGCQPTFGYRTFAAATRAGASIVHDPLTGLTFRSGAELAVGRVRLDPAVVAGWPHVHPGDVPDRHPVSLCWSPIVRCNLACPQCLDDKSVSELPYQERRRIADVLADSSVLAVDISGGEPLLLRDLPELLDVLVAGGCAVSLTTNGTHLARRAEALASRLDAVRVSLDGPDPDRHDRWRGSGSFDRAVAGIRAAVAHGIPVQIQTVLMRQSAPYAERMLPLAASLGVHGVTFLQMLPIGEGASLAATQLIPDNEAHGLLARMPQIDGVDVRLRTRAGAGGFTVIRADGQVWRNHPDANLITTRRPLRTTADLELTGRDGSA